MSNTKAVKGAKELTITRLIDAPRELVFEAWTDPNHLSNWFGPSGFRITHQHVDIRSGGSWKYIMHGPDGRDYPNRVLFSEMIRPEKIVYTHAGDVDTEPVSFETTVTFQKEGKKTRLTMHSVFDSEETLEMLIRNYGALEGGKQTVGRLDEYVSKLQMPAGEPFVIERTLEAPVAMVWKAISDRDEMKKWYFDLDAFKAEVGFHFQFAGKGSKGEEYIHLCEVMEVVPERKLTYSWRYKDQGGNSFVTFELAPEGNKTRLKLTHTGLETFPQDTPDFAKESFAKGWTAIIGTNLPKFLEKENQHA